MADIWQEFLDQNQHRVYPLNDTMTGEDVSGTFQIPTSFMVDAFFCVPPGMNTALFYVKGLIVRRFSVDVEIGYDGDGRELLVGRFTKIPGTAGINSTYLFEPADQPLAADNAFTTMTGTLIVGSMAEILQRPGQWSFQSSTTSFLATRVATGLAAVTTLTVGTDIFTGNVALKEGSGITITPSWDAAAGQTILTFSADLGGLAELQYPLVDDASIIANLTALYGQPVQTINGVDPAVADGDFTLQALDCTQVTAITGGLSIANPCSLPCCDKSVLDDAYTSISELNLRYARMEGYYQSLGRNINDLQSRMIALEI